MNELLENWLESRPVEIQNIAKRYPVGALVNDQWIIGYAELESGAIAIYTSPINPYKNYDESVKQKNMVHVECLENNHGR